MGSLFRGLLFLLFLEFVICEEFTAAASLNSGASSSEESIDYSIENDSAKIARKRRLALDNDPVSDERGIVEDVATIRKIIQLFEEVGKRVAPLILQGTSAINELLATLGQ